MAIRVSTCSDILSCIVLIHRDSFEKRPGTAGRHYDCAQAFRALPPFKGWKGSTDMSKAERHDDAYGGRANWSMDGPRPKGSELDELTVKRVQGYPRDRGRVVWTLFFFVVVPNCRVLSSIITATPNLLMQVSRCNRSGRWEHSTRSR